MSLRIACTSIQVQSDTLFGWLALIGRELINAKEPWAAR